MVGHHAALGSYEARDKWMSVSEPALWRMYLRK
jgi:hypothetical protein